ncbi:twin-arginine translocase subunit TatC [Babesia caballi]|uniref:Twin-arginine translocase subunit TatC n=1 Tax=Babesia caballi TaxID=5871 RepID=A0AAV4LZ37_BABCB|nr:twin-arginine translocase subunit TatC [Babesia caballi]
MQNVNIPSNAEKDDKKAETDGHDDTADDGGVRALTAASEIALATTTFFATRAAFGAPRTTLFAFTKGTPHPEQHRHEHNFVHLGTQNVIFTT